MAYNHIYFIDRVIKARERRMNKEMTFCINEHNRLYTRAHQFDSTDDEHELNMNYTFSMVFFFKIHIHIKWKPFIELKIYLNR